MTNNILKNGTEMLRMEISQETQVKFLDYIALLQKWNKLYNLTAITDTNEIIIKHILDSLAIAPFIKGKNILDFGSGAGLPGIPLALAFPQLNFTLLDSNNKKVKFMNHVVLSLGLKNTKVIQKRSEEFNFSPCFDTIVTRATGSLQEIVKVTAHLLCANGQLLIMKGKYPTDEIKAIPELSPTVHRLNVPYLEAERHLVEINKS
jgi:16S rRNA (guanine527-N7)-methyltransferase